MPGISLPTIMPAHAPTVGVRTGSPAYVHLSCDKDGRRPVYGGTHKFQSDPHWQDHILFYEYFLADNGAGLGASHQTGRTGLVAKLIQLFGLLHPKKFFEIGRPRPSSKEVSLLTMASESCRAQL